MKPRMRNVHICAELQVGTTDAKKYTTVSKVLLMTLYIYTNTYFLTEIMYVIRIIMFGF